MDDYQEFITKTAVLKNSIDLLNRFFQILGGFNSAVIAIKINPKEGIDLEHIISNYPEEFYDVEVLKVENLKKRLLDNFNWLKAHAIQYGEAHFLKQSHNTFNRDYFEKLLETVRLQIQSYYKDYDGNGIEVLANSRDGTYYRNLLIHGKNTSLLIYFANVIH